jgi:hypothetical protein
VGRREEMLEAGAGSDEMAGIGVGPELGLEAEVVELEPGVLTGGGLLRGVGVNRSSERRQRVAQGRAAGAREV